MNFLLNYFILILNLLEDLRKLAYEKTVQWMEKRDIVSNFINSIESRLTKFHPFTLIVGSFFVYFILRFILKNLKRFWRRISKINLNQILLKILRL